MLVAATVFAVGMVILPPIEAGPVRPVAPLPPSTANVAPAPTPPPPPPAPVTPPPAATANVAVPSPAAADAGPTVAAVTPTPTAPAPGRPDAGSVAAIEAGRAAVMTPPSTPTAQVDVEGTRTIREATATRADKAIEPTTAADRKALADKEKATDRDAAREAWRHNLPDISVDSGKAAILIPIRGSIEGATYHVISKPHAVQVNLPKATPMVTMPYYKLKREGFRQLWVKQDDAEGTTLKVVLAEGLDPQVEIKDDFVRVVIRQLADQPSQPSQPSNDQPAPQQP
jgi:hypothetical protein